MYRHTTLDQSARQVRSLRSPTATPTIWRVVRQIANQTHCGFFLRPQNDHTSSSSRTRSRGGGGVSVALSLDKLRKFFLASLRREQAREVPFCSRRYYGPPRRCDSSRVNSNVPGKRSGFLRVVQEESLEGPGCLSSDANRPVRCRSAQDVYSLGSGISVYHWARCHF